MSLPAGTPLSVRAKVKLYRLWGFLTRREARDRRRFEATQSSLDEFYERKADLHAAWAKGVKDAEEAREFTDAFLADLANEEAAG